MKYFGYLVALFCLLIAITVLASAWVSIAAPDLATKDYLSYIAIALTFCTALLTAAFNLAATRQGEELKARLSEEAGRRLADHQSELNERTGKRVAELQAQLGVETAKTIESIRAEFTKATNVAAAQLNHELTSSAEKLKAQLAVLMPQRNNGYSALYRSSTKYFLVLREMEKGLFLTEEVERAAVLSDEALGAALIVDVEDQVAYFSYIREVLFLCELAKRDLTPEALQALWAAEGRQIGAKYNELRKAFAAKVQA